MKPVSLSIKDFLIRKLAVNTMIPEKDLEVVINHQFTSALDALSIHNTVEISGFGKFLFNERRGKKMLLKYLAQKEAFERALERGIASESRRKLTEAKLKSVNDHVKTLKPKLKE
jgi:hypothetical protein